MFCRAVFAGMISGLKIKYVACVTRIILSGCEKALDFDIKDAPGKIAMKTDH